MKWKIGSQEFELLIGKKEEYKNPNEITEESILTEYAKNFKQKTSVVHNCKDYTTLQYHDVDILRLKYSDGAKWVRIFIVPKYKKKYIDDPLFSEEEKKTQLFWKSTIESKDDLDKFIDIINEDLQFRDEVDE